MKNTFAANQIVRGIVAGTFVILGMRSIGGEDGAQVKPVNSENHTETGAGEFWLPLTSIKPLQ